MKKLLALMCCALYLHSFAKGPVDAGTGTGKASGEKVLIKAISVIVNPEGNKKAPAKQMNLYSSDSPYL